MQASCPATIDAFCNGVRIQIHFGASMVEKQAI